MYLEIFLADFTVFRVFLGISRDFAEIPEFRGSATARNIRSPGIAMQYMPKQVISRFYSIYSLVFLEYGLSETTRQCFISYHTLNKE